MTLTRQARSTRSGPDLVVSMSADGDATIVALRGSADLTSLPFLADMLAAVIADHEAESSSTSPRPTSSTRPAFA